MKVWIVLVLAAVLALGAVAMKIMLRKDETMRGGREAGAAQPAASNDPVERGRAAYFKHCVACHSPDTEEYVAGISLKGYFNNPPTKLADGSVFPRTDKAIRELVQKGTKNMPPLMEGMTTQELDDILAYMHTL